MTEETITKICYTKAEVDSMIAFAVEEARRIDEASMAKHNREATIISMILGFTTLERVESEVLPYIQKAKSILPSR